MSYSKFKQYAKTFSDHYYGDYVHNIWLRYFEKTGRDLFKEKKSNRWIYKSVRNEFVNSLYGRERFTDVVKVASRGNKALEEEIAEEYIADTAHSVEEYISYEQLDKLIKARIKQYVLLTNEGITGIEFYKKYQTIFAIYDLFKAGYNGQEIAEELQVSEQSISYYKQKIQKSMSWLNPFNSSKIEVKKVISSRCWDDRTDKDDFELDGFCDNEFYQVWVHKVSKEGLLVRLKQPKEGIYKEAFKNIRNKFDIV